MIEPIWLEVAEVICINEEQVTMTGENHFLRDYGTLESAVMAPRNYWLYSNPDLVEVSTKLLFAVANAHAFEQGNKRTAFHAAAFFLELNGATLALPSNEHWGREIERVVLGTLSMAEFNELLKIFVVLP